MPLGSSSAAPVITPGPSRLNRLRRCSRWATSATEAVDDGIAPLLADQTRGDLDAGRRLAALVLGGLEQTPHAIDGCDVMALGREILGPEVALDQPAQDGVEHGIGWQRVRVLLVGPQLGRRRLGDDALGDDLALRP